MALLLFAGIVTYQTHGFGFRYSAKSMEILDRDFKSVALKSYRERTCFLEVDQDASQFRNCTSQATSPPAQSVLLWGDSHAAHLYPGLADNVGPTTQLTQFTASMCPPIVGIRRESRRHCREINDFVMDYVTRVHPDHIILAAAWTWYDWELVGETVTRLKQLQIAHIDLVGPVPVWSSGLPAALFKYSRKHPETTALPKRMMFGLNQIVAELDGSMESFAENRGIKYLSPYKILCNSEGCITMLGDSSDTVAAWDDSHLTNAGSDFVVAHFDIGLTH
jgi:hypothetical protein